MKTLLQTPHQLCYVGKTILHVVTNRYFMSVHTLLTLVQINQGLNTQLWDNGVHFLSVML